MRKEWIVAAIYLADKHNSENSGKRISGAEWVRLQKIFFSFTLFAPLLRISIKTVSNSEVRYVRKSGKEPRAVSRPAGRPASTISRTFRERRERR